MEARVGVFLNEILICCVCLCIAEVSESAVLEKALCLSHVLLPAQVLQRD